MKLVDEPYIAMMQSLFETKMFYFSDEYDLTNSFQTFVKNGCDVTKYNVNFCYNDCFLNDFIRLAALDWITPFISGFIKISYTQIGVRLAAH